MVDTVFQRFGGIAIPTMDIRLLPLGIGTDTPKSITGVHGPVGSAGRQNQDITCGDLYEGAIGAT